MLFNIMNNIHYLSRSKRKPTLRTLRNISTQISLRSIYRLIRVDTFHLRGIGVYINDSWNRKSTWGEISQSGLARVACLGWYESIFYAESTMLVFSWNDSYASWRCLSCIHEGLWYAWLKIAKIKPHEFDQITATQPSYPRNHVSRSV